MNVYIIMPVGADPEYRGKRSLLDEVATRLGVDLHLPLERPPGASPRAVVDGIEAADCIIADLSLERPSCYFELGLAQALGKRTALIAARGTNIHQAFGRNETAFFATLEEYSELLARIMSGLRSQPQR